jgi:hypothetical protein
MRSLWHRSVTLVGGAAFLAAVVLVFTAPVVKAAAAAQSEAGAGAGDAADESIDEPPAQERPAMRQLKPKNAEPKKRLRPAPVAKQRPRPPAAMGAAGQMAGGMGGGGAGLMLFFPRTAAQWKASSPREFAEIVPTMNDEIGLIVESYGRRGGELGNRSCCANNTNSIVLALSFAPTNDTEPTDRAALLERIAREFLKDMAQRKNALLRCKLRDSLGLSQAVVRKFPDRVISLVDDDGDWTLRVDQGGGKVIHKGVVNDHDKGSDVPDAQRQDFLLVAELLATHFGEGTVAFHDEVPPE